MKIISENKKAKHDFEFIKKYESGIVLTGNEIKSIREGRVNLKGSFCRIMENEIYILGMHISKFSHSNSFYKLEEKRNRKLLLKRKEINKLEKELKENNLTIVPFKIYFNDKNKCKLEIYLAKGKKEYDKSETLKEKDIKRNLEKKYK